MRLNQRAPWWVQFLFILLGSGGTIVGIKKATTVSPEPVQIDASAITELTVSVRTLQASFDEMKPDMKHLAEQVTELSKKLAVVEDRQDRLRR